ncbi:helix-turn-helix domain-containing protein [Burkholderia sp. MSMB1826]|uniref:helix-turn-helix domain-containing protein n=1 Tax=Burkholderia sp. MSMB1826 TaxID=1637875 RepID=UPI00075E4462|nr:helix-turn-helix transcriptional regulator [Burkholderia sp. MSMB1826]KVL21206.1 XRE family transcriptional regulator [Burkholderia sp. MSMB1826]
MNFIVNTPVQLGQILSSARQAKGLTQAEAAVRIGVGQSRLSLLETTRTESLSLRQLLELTALYGLELSIRTKDGRDAAAEW